MEAKALSGLKVIEYAKCISGPYCTKLLADLGAEVIKVEEPGKGDEARAYGPFSGDVPHPERGGLFLYLNCNKLGITLNVKTSTGHEILQRLLREADVFVTNYPPKIAEELGLDYSRIREIKSKIIATFIAPFGQTGPYRHYNGYAINCSALGGMTLCTGERGREPLTPPLSLGHFQAGAAGAAGTLFALFGERKTGKGQQVDVSEADVWAICHTGHMMAGYVMAGMKRMRWGHRTPGIYPYTILPCKDGYVFMYCPRGSDWKRFLEIIGGGKMPDWYADVPKFSDRRELSLEYADQMDALLAPWLLSHTKKEIYDLCRKELPIAPINTAAEVLKDEHLTARQYFVETDHEEAGRLKYPGAPYKFSETPWRIERAAPLLGEHNELIYCQRLGFSREELISLRKEGVI